jgi:hypothetical protein
MKKASLNANGPFLAELTEEQRLVFEQIRALLEKPLPDLDWHYQLGSRLVEYRDHSVNKNGWQKALAEALGTSTSRLQKEMQFRSQYDSDQLAKFISAGYNWGLVETVAAVRDEAKRLVLMAEAQRRDWNLSEVKLRMKELQDAQVRLARGKDRGGRPIRQAVHPDAILQQMIEQTAQWLKRFRTAWNPETFDLVARLAQGATVQKTGSLLTEAERQAKQLAEAALTLQKALRKVRRTLERRNSVRPE